MKNIELSALPIIALKYSKQLGRYRVVLFILFFVGLAGYLVMQINTSVNIQPDSAQQVSATKRLPRIDPAVVKQLQQLQDNSVNVQALFNQNRSNPFQ